MSNDAPARECQPEADGLRQHTPTPWTLCHHLQSAEKDASCKCGYRGSIWGDGGELLVCEMRNCDLHEGHDMTPVGTRAEQLANAAFIVEAVNSHATLQARVDELTKALKATREQLIKVRDASPEIRNHELEINRVIAQAWHTLNDTGVATPLERSGGAT